MSSRASNFRSVSGSNYVVSRLILKLLGSYVDVTLQGVFDYPGVCSLISL